MKKKSFSIQISMSAAQIKRLVTQTRFVRIFPALIVATAELDLLSIHLLTLARTLTSVKSIITSAWRLSAAITQSAATDVFERRAAARDILLMRKRKIAKVKNSIFFTISSIKSSFRSCFFTCSRADDDECTLSRHNCFDPYECHNTKGKLRVYLLGVVQ